MSVIARNIISLKKELPSSVKLVAVSKTKPVPEILEAYNAGHRIFGENRVQELLSKRGKLPPDIEWHLIGHLQSNKVKYIAPFISMIHSVDSYRLLQAIEAEGKKAGRRINCLIQFHIAVEESKFGFTLEEAQEMLDTGEFRHLEFARICGVMGMASFTDDQDSIRNEFRNLAAYFRVLKEKYFPGVPAFKEISMGMSGDFGIALEEGSTIVRLGSIIFGNRT